MNTMEYPLCKKVEYQEEFFGMTLEDPYRWLQDAKNPEVLDFVARENSFTDNWFEEQELQTKKEALQGKKVGAVYQSIFSWKDGYAAVKVSNGDNHIFYLNNRMEEETLVFDRNTIADFVPSELRPCPKDETKIAVSGIYDGDARMSVIVIDCENKKILKEFRNFGFSSIWSGTRPVLYYAAVQFDEEVNENRTALCGYDVERNETVCLFEDSLQSVFGRLYADHNGQFILFEVMNDYSHSRFYSYKEANGELTELNGGGGTELVYMDSLEGVHYFISKESAPLGKVLAVGSGKTLAQAEVVLPEDAAVLETGFILGGKLFVMMMEDVRTKLLCLHDGKKESVELPEIYGTAVYAGRSGNQVFFKYESFVTKPKLLSFDGEKMTTVTGKEQRSCPDIVVEQRRAPSTWDGTEIPYFIVRRKDAPQDGNNPAWIYAYGGYNVAMMPGAYEWTANLDIADWVEKGGIYILASIRGGSEYGAAWHEGGMLQKKKNCYYDFIGITEQIIKDRWTNPGKVVISGLSNGGLLMAALVTMRPDLFQCVIASVPHTDMIQFTADAMGPMYITEYGNPMESREMFQYFLSYSPYHNVKKTDYPFVYIQTGECDNNVPPYHGKKFAAKMQEMNQSDNPVLLRVLEKGSHDRGSGEAYWQTVAEMQLFAEKALGL